MLYIATALICIGIIGITITNAVVANKVRKLEQDVKELKSKL